METKQVLIRLIIGLFIATITVALAAIFTPNGSNVFYFITIPTVIGYILWCILIEHQARKPIDNHLHSHKRDLMHPDAIRHLPIDDINSTDDFKKLSTDVIDHIKKLSVDAIDSIDANSKNIMAAMELDLELEQDYYDNINTKLVPVKDINGDNLTPKHYLDILPTNISDKDRHLSNNTYPYTPIVSDRDVDWSKYPKIMIQSSLVEDDINKHRDASVAKRREYINSITARI